MYHISSVADFISLCGWLPSDREFSHHELRKDIQIFMSHAVKLSRAFELLDNQKSKAEKKVNKKKTKIRHSNSVTHKLDREKSKLSTEPSVEIPVCLYRPQQKWMFLFCETQALGY